MIKQQIFKEDNCFITYIGPFPTSFLQLYLPLWHIDIDENFGNDGKLSEIGKK